MVYRHRAKTCLTVQNMMCWWMEVGREAERIKLDGFSLILVQHSSAGLVKSRRLKIVDEALNHSINVVLIFEE